MIIRSIFAFLIMIFPLAAETLGDLQFQLPSEASDWKKIDDLKGEQHKGSLSAIYAPDIKTEDQPVEFFGIHILDHPLEDKNVTSIDQAKLEKILEQQFPESQMKVNIVEQLDHSVIYEWSVKDNGHEVLHGLTRLFLNPNQTVELGIVTEKVKTFNQTRSVWLKALKDASITSEKAL